MDREFKSNHAGIKLPSKRQDYIRRKPELCLSEQERRKYQVNVGLNIGEVEILDAQRGAISRAAYFRGLLSSASLPRHAPIPAVNTKAYAELARLAANLNQFSRHLNETRAGLGQQAASARLIGNIDDLKLSIELAMEKVDGLRGELIGAGSPP